MLGFFLKIIFSFLLYDFVILEKSLISASIKVSCTEACSCLDPKTLFITMWCVMHM